MSLNTSRYARFFRQGSGITSWHDEGTTPFSSMSAEQKKNYAHRVLFALVEEYPDDEGVAEFVAVGKRELLGSSIEKLLFALGNQKVNIYATTISFCLLLLFGQNEILYLRDERRGKLPEIEKRTL